jgi:hypothetical protein
MIELSLLMQPDKQSKGYYTMGQTTGGEMIASGAGMPLLSGLSIDDSSLARDRECENEI